MGNTLLEFKNLVTEFHTEGTTVKAVNDISFTLNRGETIGIVGESGSGKSVTSLSAMRLIPSPPGVISGGEIIFHQSNGEATDLLAISEEEMRKFRGNEIAMIFQEPMTSLNPVFTIGLQVMESIKPKTLFQYFKDGILSVASTINDVPVGLRVRLSLIMGTVLVLFSQLVLGWSFFWKDVALFFMIGTIFPSLVAYLLLGLRELISDKYKHDYETLFLKGADLLRRVGIPDPEKRMYDYPHQFSGGMRQRVMIAMSLAKKPSLLIADEPTTALDVTIQAQILDLMMELKDQNREAAIVLITHDMAVVAETCERVMVMYGGMIQEVADVDVCIPKLQLV